MADIFRLGQTGKFSRELTIDLNKYKTNPVDLTNQSRLFIKFKKPDGTTTTVDGTLVSSEITVNLLLDQRGDWLYTVGVEYNDGTIIESINAWLFWVV